MEEVLVTSKYPECEYFCRGCLQLRLSFLDDTVECGNCKSKDIIKGKLMELNKESLIKEVTNG